MSYEIQAQETLNHKFLEAQRTFWVSILKYLPASFTPLLASALACYQKVNLLLDRPLF